MPEINYWCFRLFSRSFTIKETTVAGIRAKPIDTTKAVKIPLDEAALNFNFKVIGYGEVVILNFRLGFPKAF